MRLNEERRALAEDNMGLVGLVIKDRVRDISRIGLYTYDDLFQIGCMGLCKAAATHTPGRSKFSTYAYMLIRNEIFSALAYATLRKNRETVTEPCELSGPCIYDELPDGTGETLDHALRAATERATGVTAKGIEAIRLLAEGYTHREIGECLGGVSANNVSAWVARARKFLRADPTVVSLRESI
jgi:RNA polymerase sigma factor (sigma-70 family)